MAGYLACASAINEATGHAFDDDELETILSGLQARAQAIKALSGGTIEEREAFATAARQLGDEARATAAVERRNAVENLAKRTALRDRVQTKRNWIAGLFAEMRGTVTGGKYSAEAEGRVLSTAYAGGMENELRRAGKLKAAQNPANEALWARERLELSKGAEGNPGVTGSRQALDIARIVEKYQTLAKTEANKAGAWIGDLNDYISHQTQDPDRIRRAGFDAWAADQKMLLDPAFLATLPDADKFLRGVFNGFRTGVHLTEEGRQGFKDPAFTGPGNLAKRLSADRVLHYRDADAFLENQRRYGNPNLLGGVTEGLMRLGQSTALLRRFGTNPAAELAAHIKWFAQEFRDTRPDDVEALLKKEPQMLREMATLDGTANKPVNRLLHRIVTGSITWEGMSRLGNVLFTHLGVGFTKPALLRQAGMGLLESTGSTLRAFVKGRGGAGEDEVLDLLHAWAEGRLRDITSRFQIDDSLPGMMTKWANNFYKATGLTGMLGRQKPDAQFILSRFFGRRLDTAFDELKPATQKYLSDYGIGAAEWDAMRQAPDHPEIDGRKFLTPDAALRAGLGDDTAMKLHVLFHDSADRSVITPGIATKAALIQGTRPGTALGSVLRWTAQFKQWPVEASRELLGNQLYGGKWQASAIGTAVHLAVGATVFGYLRMVLGDLAKGRNPRDPRDPHTWEAALLQGGGAGILGDYLFGEYNRFGQGPMESAAGPVLGQGATAVMDLFNRAKERALDPDKKPLPLAPEALRLVLDNTPFLNLFYVRSALNYAFLWQAQEALDPGYLRRFEARVRQQNHQTFWLRPIAGKIGTAGISAPDFSGKGTQ